MSELIFSQSDVAQLLRVTPAAVSNYITRFDDTPEPTYMATDGRRYWTPEGMAQWQAWQSNRRHENAKNANAHDAVEKLRQQLQQGETS